MENIQANLLQIGITNPSLLKLFTTSFLTHKKSEEKFYENIKEIFENEDVEIKKNEKVKQYFEKNFFSILFISIFKILNISKENTDEYALILHSLRALITSTDNLLDNDNKGKTYIEYDNLILENTLNIIMAQKIMSKSIRSITSFKNIDTVENQIIISISEIAKGEALSQLKNYKTYPKPEEIIEKVHLKIGGILLQLAFISPLLIEISLKENILLMKDGIMKVGTALQMLDDMTDIIEDAETDKVNLLSSRIIYSKGLSFDKLKSELKNYKELYKEEIANLVKDSINHALEGFKLLEKGGYPLGEKDALKLMKLLFKLRGLKEEWNIYTKLK